MSTNPATEQLSAYLDGELSDAEVASIRIALESDADLRAELARLEGVQRLMRAHGPARAPEGFAQRVLAAAASEENVVALPWWRRPFGVPVEGVLIAAAAALALIVAMPRAQQNAESPTPAAPVEQAEPPAPGENDGVAEAEGADEDLQPSDPGDPSSKDTPEKVGSSKLAPKPAPEKSTTRSKYEAQQPPAAAESGTSDEQQQLASPPAKKGTPKPSDPVMAAAAMRVEHYTDNEEFLGTLQALVARHGGTIRDPSGTPVKTGLLSDPETTLLLDIPADRITALSKELTAMGARVETTDAAALTGGSSLKLPIRIVLTAPQK